MIEQALYMMNFAEWLFYKWKTADDIDDINYRFKTYVCQGLSPLALVTHTHTHTAL